MKNHFIVIMGVSGSGKSTIGKMLAQYLGVDFIEGDDFHSPVNIEKMKAGVPLTSADRLPWLTQLQGILHQYMKENTSVVVSCSALKKEYRNILRKAGPQLSFLFLNVSVPVLEKRLDFRKEHFMKVDLLRSQLETLDYPAPDENDVTIVPADGPEKEVLRDIVRQLLR